MVIKHGWSAIGHAQEKDERGKTSGREDNIWGLTILRNWNLFPILPIKSPDMFPREMGSKQRDTIFIL